MRETTNMQTSLEAIVDIYQRRLKARRNHREDKSQWFQPTHHTPTWEWNRQTTDFKDLEEEAETTGPHLSVSSFFPRVCLLFSRLVLLSLTFSKIAAVFSLCHSFKYLYFIPLSPFIHKNVYLILFSHFLLWCNLVFFSSFSFCLPSLFYSSYCNYNCILIL